MKRALLALVMPVWALPIVVAFTLVVAGMEFFGGIGDALGGRESKSPFSKWH